MSSASIASAAHRKGRTNVTIACDRCRRLRRRCDGIRPECGPCGTRAAGSCTYSAETDNRKPFTKNLVVAMQNRIQSLEEENAVLERTIASLRGNTDLRVQKELTTSPRRNPPPMTIDVEVTNSLPGLIGQSDEGGFRFYGSTSIDIMLPKANRPFSRPLPLQSSSFSHTHQHDKGPPCLPIPLSDELFDRILNLAFAYTTSWTYYVRRASFSSDLATAGIGGRTHDYSLFLLLSLLAVGSRYLPDDGNEACQADGYPERGDAFALAARKLVDTELESPMLSTVRGMLLLGHYYVGRGRQEQLAWIYAGIGFRIAEDFGLQLDLESRLDPTSEQSMQMTNVRRDCFWMCFINDVLWSVYTGRPTSMQVDHFDQALPTVDFSVELEDPMFQTSALLHLAKLCMITNRMMNSIYGVPQATNSTGVVSEIHLALAEWRHAAPGHLKIGVNPDRLSCVPHIICLNQFYNTTTILLHRPFFRSLGGQDSSKVSREACVTAALDTIRLARIQEQLFGFANAPLTMHHNLFVAGTVFLLMAVADPAEVRTTRVMESGLPSDKVDPEEACRQCVSYLRSLGRTWPGPEGTADHLENLVKEWCYIPDNQNGISSLNTKTKISSGVGCVPGETQVEQDEGRSNSFQQDDLTPSVSQSQMDIAELNFDELLDSATLFPAWCVEGVIWNGFMDNRED